MEYRASRQSSTKHSPYYMLFQQHMRLPVDSELLTSDPGKLADEREDGEGLAEVIRQLLESWQKVLQKAESNIAHAQKN